jgi:hypothetical protein
MDEDGSTIQGALGCIIYLGGLFFVQPDVVQDTVLMPLQLSIEQ